MEEATPALHPASPGEKVWYTKKITQLNMFAACLPYELVKYLSHHARQASYSNRLYLPRANGATPDTHTAVKQQANLAYACRAASPQSSCPQALSQRNATSPYSSTTPTTLSCAAPRAVPRAHTAPHSNQTYPQTLRYFQATCCADSRGARAWPPLRTRSASIRSGTMRSPPTHHDRLQFDLPNGSSRDTVCKADPVIPAARHIMNCLCTTNFLSDWFVGGFVCAVVFCRSWRCQAFLAFSVWHCTTNKLL